MPSLDDDFIESFTSPLPATTSNINGVCAASKDCINGEKSLEACLHDWQEWLLAALEDHRNSLSKEIASQFEASRFKSPGKLRGLERFKKGDTCESPSHDAEAMATASTGDSEKQSRNSKDRPSTAGNDMHSTKVEKPANQNGVKRVSFQNHVSSSSVALTQTDHEQINNVVKQLVPDDNGAKEEKEEAMNVQLSSVLGLKSQNGHRHLDVFISFIIFLNVVTMIIELEWQSHMSQLSLGWDHDTSSWKGAKRNFKIVEHVYNGIFVVEGFIRFYMDGCWYFQQRLNLVDFFLVFTSSIQLWILEPLNIHAGENLTIFRCIRFARFVRVLKVMRMKMFTDLRVLVKTCISSMIALFWSMVLLFLIIGMSGLFLCALLKEVIQSDTYDHGLRVWVYRHYGNAGRAAYTLFEVTLAGCWPTYFRPLIEQISGWYGMFAVLYITFVVFAVIRIITAIFLKQTLMVADSDAEMLVNEARAKTEKNMEKLRRVFAASDLDGKGVLSYDEFVRVVTNKDVQAWLHTLELDVQDVQGLFNLLDDGDGKITYDEFISGILRLKGQARSLDVVAVGRHCDKMDAEIQDISWKLDCIASKLRLML